MDKYIKKTGQIFVNNKKMTYICHDTYKKNKKKDKNLSSMHKKIYGSNICQ